MTSSYCYNQYERMTHEEKDRLCDNNDQTIQEIIRRRNERERLFDYNIPEENNNKITNNSRFKRQLTSGSHIDDDHLPETDDSSTFTVVSRGAKRKQRNANDKERYVNNDEDTTTNRHTTHTTSHNGGRLFINSKGRMNKNNNNHAMDTSTVNTKEHQYEKKNERKRSNHARPNSDDETDCIELSMKTNLNKEGNNNNNNNTINNNINNNYYHSSSSQCSD